MNKILMRHAVGWRYFERRDERRGRLKRITKAVIGVVSLFMVAWLVTIIKQIMIGGG